MTYARDGRVARITLDRPERGNGITLEMPRELSACVERANLDPEVHAIALAGNGTGFCGGYDLVRPQKGLMPAGTRTGGPERAEARPAGLAGRSGRDGAPTTTPTGTWDPVVDFQMMWRNVRGFMSLFHSEKPVLCKVHGFCVAGGTDMALCSDLLVVADDARIGYPPARVWGVPTTALWAWRIGPDPGQAAAAHRRLAHGRRGGGVGAGERVGAGRGARRALRGSARAGRPPAGEPARHAQAARQPGRLAQGLHATQALGTFFDGIARHTPEGYGFTRRAAEAGWREAVRERDEPFGDSAF